MCQNPLACNCQNNGNLLCVLLWLTNNKIMHYHSILCGKRKLMGHLQNPIIISVEDNSVDVVLSPVRWN